MNRILLEEILKKMKINLENKKDIGNLKVGALYAIGSQLEAIFYFLGHELGSKFTDSPTTEKLSEFLAKVSEKYDLGIFKVKEEDEEHIIFSLGKCKSSEDIATANIKSETMFCSFEAGLFAGVVEKVTKKHCFAQEQACKVQGTVDECEFIIVIPKE